MFGFIFITFAGLILLEADDAGIFALSMGVGAFGLLLFLCGV